MPRHSHTPRLTAANPWFVVFSVALCLGMAAYFVPRKEEVVKRLVEDGEHARALEIAAGQPLETPAALPAAEAAKKLSPLEILQLSLSQQAGGGEVHPDAIAAIGQSADPQACLDFINRVADAVDPAVQDKLLLATAHSALAKNQPRLAAEIYTRILTSGSGNDDLVRDAVQAWRWAGPEFSTQALQTIRNWQAAGHAPSREMRHTEIALLREMNRPGEALDLMLEDFSKSAPSMASDDQAIPLLIEVAGQAGAVAKILPLLEQFVAATPAGQASFEDLANGRIVADAKFLAWGKMLAQHSEWNGQPDKAVDYYMKLGVCGDMSAVERVEALQAGLCRQGDWLALLRHVAPTPHKVAWTLELARLLAGAAENEEARQLYEGWLMGHPSDIAAWKELAFIFEDESNLQGALAAYQKASAAAPNDLDVKKSIASLQISLRQFSDAFDFYHQLAEKDHDAATLESYALLAESLAQYRAFNRALILRQHRLKKPTGQDYQELARSFEIIGDTNGLIATYKDGMERLPTSRILRIDLASTYRREGYYDEAIALLALPELKSDMQAMQLFIEVCCLKEDYQFALAFLGRGFEKKFAFGPEVRLDLGHIYFNNGYAAEADAMYSSVDDEPTLWPLIANARFKRGDYQGAESYQKKYLASLQLPDAEGWMFLGDIYKMQGRTQESTTAYAKSLALLEQKIAPPPPPTSKTASTSKPPSNVAVP